MKQLTLALSIAVCLGLHLGACTSDDDDGTPPVIASLTVSPQAVPVGVQTTVSGTMTFVDEDGDVRELGAAVVTPAGARSELAEVPIQTSGTPTEGTVTWALIIQPPSAGTYRLELWVLDAAGHESNRLSGSLSAQ